MKSGSRLERVLTSGAFAVTGELGPPKSGDPEGRFAVENFTLALELAHAGKVAAVCYTPFNKKAMRFASAANAPVLAIAVTVVAIVVELAANRYSHLITRLFVREPVNLLVEVVGHRDRVAVDRHRARRNPVLAALPVSLGFDHERLTFYHNGIRRRLTEFHKNTDALIEHYE